MKMAKQSGLRVAAQGSSTLAPILLVEKTQSEARMRADERRRRCRDDDSAARLSVIRVAITRRVRPVADTRLGRAAKFQQPDRRSAGGSCVRGKLPGHAINDLSFPQPERGTNAIGG